MIEEIRKTGEYLRYLEEHYNNVQRSWRTIQEKCAGKSCSFIYDDFKFFTLDREIKLHDQSKLSNAEFTQYRRKFYPTEHERENFGDEIKADFEKAWEHHKLNNNHHWELWAKLEERHPDNPLIGLCVIHNICDWMAMGMKFNDTAQSYYEKNKDGIIISKSSKRFMYEMFERIYK